MKRRLTILLSSFCFLLVIFFIYYGFSKEGNFEKLKFWKQPPPLTHSGTPATLPGYGEFEPGTKLRISQYDKNHRLQAQYSADKWDKVGERFRLQQPRMEWFSRRGQMVVVTADEGTVIAKEVSKKWSIREGELTGHVVITMDRRYDPDIALGARPDDAVHVHVDEIRFDNDLLTIASDSEVVVNSKEADVLGKGLRLSWSEGPQELRELKIEKGRSMTIRQGQDRFLKESWLSPTSQPAVAAAGPTTRKAPKPAGGPAVASAPVKTPTTRPSPSTPEGVLPTVPDTYTAVFTGQVEVVSGPRHLKGADELRLIFEYRSPKQSKPATQPATGAPGAAKPVETPGSAPSAEPMVVTWTGPLVVRPLRGLEPAVLGRMDVAASGSKLELADADATATCSSFQYFTPAQKGELVGTAAQPVVMVTAEKERVTAEKVRIDRQAGQVNFDGPGSMYMPNAGRTGGMGKSGDKATTQPQEINITWSESVVAFFQQNVVSAKRPFLRDATFIGSVYVKQAANQELKADKLALKFAPAEKPGDQPNRIQHVHATGNVYMADNTAGDFLKAQDSLDVSMATTEDGKTYPTRAVARGKVSARQEKTDITGEEVTVTFAPVQDAATKATRYKPQRLDATGDVHVIDNRDPQQVITASADILTASLAEQAATLLGRPAKDGKPAEPAHVTQKDNSIDGMRIYLDQLARSIKVDGAGKLRAYTDSDVSGNKTDKPQPVDIAWAESMYFRGNAHKADVKGKVDLVTGGDRIQCQTMQVEFAPADAAATQAAPAPTTASKPSRGLGALPRQKIVKVFADKDVRMESVRKDSEFLLRSMLLLAEQFYYDRTTEHIRCPGAGRLVAEDYRPPEKKSQGGSDDPLSAGSMDRPWQSAFRWSTGMELDQAQRLVTMTGSVQTVLRSGKQMVLTERLPIRPWGNDLPAGRHTLITCEKMISKFLPPDDVAVAKPAAGKPDPARQPAGHGTPAVPGGDAVASPAVKPAAKADPAARAVADDPFGGARIGRMDRFDATGDVNLVDGQRQVICQRMLYELNDPAGKLVDRAIIWGNLEGQPASDALMFFQDKSRGALDSWKSPQLIWHRGNNRIEAKNLEAGGGM